MMTVICFPEDVIAVFHEVNRVLRPGGMLVVGFIEAGALPTNQRPLRLTSHPLMVFPGVNEQMKTHPLAHILFGIVRLCRYIVPTVNTRVNPASAVISIHTGKKCVPVNEYRTRSVK